MNAPVTRPRTRSTALGGITNLSVLAPLRNGMVPSFEPISYLARLRKVLDALHASRQNLRESELWPVFPDVIGRFGIIHNFRYALVAPDSMPEGVPNEFGTWRLSLNVTFDGGWEPYMRVIQRDIGPLLDLLFCHSADYPGSSASFEKYCDWVRKYEVPAGLFYADSSLTVDDGHYLSRMEALQREGAPDAELAGYRQPSGKEQREAAMRKALDKPRRALAVPFRTLKGLYRLSTYFPRHGTLHPLGDEGVLRRFAQDVLRYPIEFMSEIPKRLAEDPPSPERDELEAAWKEANALFPDELAWLEWDKLPQPPEKAKVVVDPDSLQSHVLGFHERMTHGCLVLLRVLEGATPQECEQERQNALATIAALAADCGPVRKPGDIGCLVGFTYAGLQALGVTQDRLDKLPQEFVEGMEARHTLLGDVRTNHPDRWTRPLLWKQPSRQRADLKTVHLLVQLRIEDRVNQDELHPDLEKAAVALGAPGTGLRVLALEPTRSYRDTFPGGVTHSVGHMGIADGVSQPRPPMAGPPPNPGKQFTEVSAGELLLGYANDRGDDAPDAPDAFLHDGTFLVVRKLRQWMDRLDAVHVDPDQRTAILESMIGRRADGTPLHREPGTAPQDNDFDFEKPDPSAACPFHSHIRRCNPRDGRSYTPRILRRGMSYGLESKSDRTADRGVMFMAYCASISEQFETLQRWVAGGNSSGVGSAQGDPLLRVPQEGEDSTFRYLHKGAPRRVEFNDQPLVTLQWGLYAFVPSLAALQSFAQFSEPPAVAPGDEPEGDDGPDPEEVDREEVRALLEDRDKSAQVWQWVRDRHPFAPQDRAYGELLGRADEVLAAMKDGGAHYSVKGYGVRKTASVGPNLLGMDPEDDSRKREVGVKEVIAAVTEPQAFAIAQNVVGAVLRNFPVIPSAAGDPERRPIDLVSFSDFVLAGLCRIWFGLPDGNLMVTGGRLADNPGKARCPGNLTTASRYIFTPHPRQSVIDAGQQQGKKVNEAVAAWLQTPGMPPAGTLSAGMQAELAKTGSQDRLANNIAGMMLGFTPTVQGSFLRVMETWISEEASLWEHQQALLAVSPDKPLTFDEAKKALRDRLFATMRKHPVPEMLWRSPVDANGNVVADAKQRVVLGIASALAEPHAPNELVFGRDKDGAAVETVHGCPGYHMAMGVLLAMIGGLFKAGTLRPTGSPVLLILTPNT